MTLLTEEERAAVRTGKAITARLAKERRQRVKAARPAEKRNRGRVRDAAHLAFIRRLPCVATWVETGVMAYGCQAAHVRLVREGKPGAMGVKPSDKWSLPLTPEMHDRQTNRGGERGFWSALGVDPIDLAARIHAVSGDAPAAVQIIRDLRTANQDQELPND